MGHLLKILILMGFMCTQVAAAQEETPSPNSKAIVERCITEFTEPSDQWSFDGTIITYQMDDGIHGFRADTASRYYIAFDNDAEYARSGALSPDGHWFASYLGEMQLTDSMMFNNNYFITNIRVVSTLPSRETYIIPFKIYQYGPYASFSPVMWIDNTQFVADSYHQGGIDHAWYLVNPFLGTISEMSEEEGQEFNESDFLQQSPGWRSDSQYIYFPSLEEVIVSDNAPRAFLEPAPQGQKRVLYVTDVESQKVYNTCIETDYSIAVSPTSDQVAVSIGGKTGFVYIVDLNDWVAYRLNLATNRIIAWVADQ